MTPQLQTLLNASTSLQIPQQDITNLAEIYLWSVQLGVTDPLPTIFKNALDVAQCTPEARQLIRLFALAKKNGLDTNWVPTLQALVTNNLYTGPNSIDPGRAAPALDYVFFRGLGVL